METSIAESSPSFVPDVVVENEGIGFVGVGKGGGGGDKIEASSETVRNEDDYWTDVRCEPVIDFLHARVFTHALEVYGKIDLIDLEPRNSFPAYDRDLSESQRLYSGNFLQLSGPQEIPTLNQPMADVNIKSVDTGDVIAHGRQPLPKSTHHPHDDAIEQLFTLKFQAAAEEGVSHLELQCAAFTFGVYAEVRTFLHKDIGQKIDQDQDEGLEIFGLIYAQCNPLLVAKENYKNHMFNVVKQEHEWVGFGDEIVLSKNLVAVPAYSELEISLDLSCSEDAGFEDDGFRVQGTVCFRPSNYYAGRKDVPGGNGYYVRVDVTWQEPSLLNKPYCNEDLVAGFRPLPRSPTLYASHLVEVFSLFISRPNGKELNLHGSVTIFDASGWCNIFKRSKEEAYFLSRGCNLLPMQGPERAVKPGMTFVIIVDLSDVDGHFKINGCAHSSVGIDERQRPWFDRRLCSVVKNEMEKSFVAVHYTVFAFAVQAIVSVGLVCPRSSDRVKMYGDIIASYGNLPYSTIYDKQFFRRVLFACKEANSLKVDGYLELPKNLVAVPMTSSLLAEVNLSFQTAEGAHHVGEIVEFQIGDECQIQVASDVADISIDVKWKILPYV